MKIAVITGGSSGVGKCTATLFSKRGFKVYELSRSGKTAENINHITCDITNENDVKLAFQAIYGAEGKIDVLINNAGFGISGAIEFTEIEDAKRLFDVNFFGAVRCVKAVVPYMRSAGGGKIINISSVAAPLALPFQAFYSCTKASINAFTLALANELRRFNITVCAVMPGDAKTGFTAARQKNFLGADVYGSVIENSVKKMERDEQKGVAPEFLAKCIYKAACKKHPAPFYTPGLQYKFFVLLSRLLPMRVGNFILGLLYAN